MEENTLVIDPNRPPSRIYAQEEREKRLKKPEDLNYVRLPFDEAHNIMKKTFEQLTASHFEEFDRGTEGFYKQYISIINRTNARKARYVKYQEAKLNPAALTKKVHEDLCAEFDGKNMKPYEFKIPDIFSFYFSTICNNDSSRINQTIIDVCAFIYPTGELKAKKSHIMKVLSDFLQDAFATNDTNTPDDVDDSLVRTEITAVLVSECEKEMGHAIVSQKNEKHARYTENRNIYAVTEAKCTIMRENTKLYDLISVAHLIKVPEAGIRSEETIVTAKDVPLTRRKKTYPTLANIVVTNTRAIAEAFSRTGALLVNAGSQMFPGSRVEQGIDSNEAPLCMSSTISLAYAKVVQEYPMSDDRILYFPNVMIFRDFSQANYPIISPDKVVQIAVINSPPRYRPTTNLIDQDPYNMDTRLYLPTTQFLYEARARNQIRNIFELAAYLGYRHIIFDEFGVEDNWAPPHHMAQIMADVARQYRQHFISIIFAIDKSHLYQIYSKYLNN